MDLSGNDLDGCQEESKLVLSLIRRSNETKTRVRSEAGALGEEIKKAVENKHLHAGALKLVARLARMDAGKRDDFSRAFDLYRDYVVEGGLFGDRHMGDLVDQAHADDGDAQTENIAASNVSSIKRGIKQLSDTA